MEKMLYLSIQYLRSSDKLHNSSEKTKQCVLISVSQRTRKNVKRLEEMSKKKKEIRMHAGQYHIQEMRRYIQNQLN